MTERYFNTSNLQNVRRNFVFLRVKQNFLPPRDTLKMKKVA